MVECQLREFFKSCGRDAIYFIVARPAQVPLSAPEVPS